MVSAVRNKDLGYKRRENNTGLYDKLELSIVGQKGFRVVPERDSLILDHRYVIYNIVSKKAGIAKRIGIDPQDLVQEGFLGLIEAAKRYNPKKDAAFSTYSHFWVRAYVNDAMRESPIVHRSKNYERNQKKIELLISDHYRKHGEKLDPREAGRVLGISDIMIERALEAGEFDVSLDAPLHSQFQEDDQVKNRHETFSGDPPSQEATVEANEVLRLLSEPQQEALIGIHVLGFKHRELAGILGLSHNAVYTRIKSAEKKLAELELIQ